MSWLPSPVTNDRTIAVLWASFASWGKAAPYVTPGSDVLISPETLRISEGAPILGSKSSIWGGPPCMKRKTTDLPVRTFSPSAARARSASVSPPRVRPPTRRNSRRFQPGSRKLNMLASPGYSTPPHEQTGEQNRGRGPKGDGRRGLGPRLVARLARVAAGGTRRPRGAEGRPDGRRPRRAASRSRRLEVPRRRRGGGAARGRSN